MSDKGVLVITVKESEEIAIGEDIIIAVKRATGRSCRVVVVSPKSVRIERRLSTYEGKKEPAHLEGTVGNFAVGRPPS